jgi:ABC-type uncharacterized transport system substrate-binding protein
MGRSRIGGERSRFTARIGRWCALLVLVMSDVLGSMRLAAAHPNIWIECRIVFVFQCATVIAIEETWTMDRKFSRVLLSDYDKNRDGRYDARESQAVGRGVLPNLAAYRYFTYVWLDGKDLGRLTPRKFVAFVRNGRVIFHFSVPLPNPVEPRRQKLQVEVYDHEYYAQVDLAKRDPVLLRGARGIVCRSQIRTDKRHPYFGYIYPPAITLSCQ